MRCISLGLIGLAVLAEFGVCAEPTRREALAALLREMDPRAATLTSVESAAEPDALCRTLDDDIRERIRSVNEQDVRRWRELRSAEDWRRFKTPRIEAPRRSLGDFPEPPSDLNARVAKTIEGDGFRIECLVFESRPGLLVTANLYQPAKRRDSMPGILLCHSHHNPKTQDELQDMGVHWARSGCLVLIMDQLGHGERRQHSFRTAKDYAEEFPVGRQDYYFRYNVGMQLHLVGESLIGWMVWDLMRGVDLLLERPGVDPKRILLLGSVAGGGDPAAVTAVLDQRISAVVPFNFGGPQPETKFPLPDDAALQFNYVGGGSWESTRNLRRSACDGFLPWVIVASVAPRRLIYAHEFSWDRERDPVWRRLQTIYQWFDAEDHLASLHGYGGVQLSSQEASHCNNIGPHHRGQIHPVFRRWCGIQTQPLEYAARRQGPDLLCVEGVDSAGGLRWPRIHQLADRLARQRVDRFRKELQGTSAAQRREELRSAWARVLGFDAPSRFRTVQVRSESQRQLRVKRVFGRTDRFALPAMLLAPDRGPQQGCPCVVAVAQGGKAGFLAHRSEEIAELIERGVAVCLPDLPGSGETSPGGDRGRSSSATTISSSRLMLGGTMVGDRLSDLLGLIAWLRAQEGIDGRRIAVWGDSFAVVHPPQRNLSVPFGIDDEPEPCEPIGAALSLLAGLFDARIQAVLARGGLVSMRSLLDSQFVHIPHDFVIPGVLAAGDLADLAASLAPASVRVDGLVDGTNRRASSALVKVEWGAAGAERVPAGVSGADGRLYGLARQSIRASGVTQAAVGQARHRIASGAANGWRSDFPCANTMDRALPVWRPVDRSGRPLAGIPQQRLDPAFLWML